MTTTVFNLGELLKSNATKIAIKAKNVKMGDLVDYPVRGKKLVALSDSEHDKVLVAPHNCVIDLDFVNLGSLDAKTLIKEGDAYGIIYVGTKAAAIDFSQR